MEGWDKKKSIQDAVETGWHIDFYDDGLSTKDTDPLEGSEL